jgi:hypothetical protein
MATLILMLFLGLLTFFITPWIGELNQRRLHTTDLMAGDEGED